MEDFLTKGFTASFRPIDEAQCHLDNEQALVQSNHKSATKHINILRKNISKEVEYGY